MANNVFIDTETGGLVESQHSLISIAAIITDERYTELDRVEYFIKQPYYVVTPKAMAVNKIDLTTSDTWAEPEAVKADFLDFLKLPANIMKGVSNDRGRWLVHGKNPGFDVRFLKVFLGEEMYRSMFLYYERDITDTYVELSDIGVYPKLAKMSLQDLCVALEVDVGAGAFHGALFDTEMTVKCMQAMDRKKQWVKKLIEHYQKTAQAKRGS